MLSSHLRYIIYNLIIQLLAAKRGESVFAISQKVKTNLYLQLEARAINQTIKLSYFIFSKLELKIPQRILNTCSNMSYLVSQSSIIYVNWVLRNSGAAHTLAKQSLNHNVFGYFDIGCSSLESIIKVEANNLASLQFFCFLINTSFPLKKKNYRSHLTTIYVN